MTYPAIIDERASLIASLEAENARLRAALDAAEKLAASIQARWDEERRLSEKGLTEVSFSSLRELRVAERAALAAFRAASRT